MSLTYVTLTELAQDGSATDLSGTGVFTPSATVYASGIPVLIPDVPVQAQIIAGQLKNASGAPLALLANDNTGLSIQGLSGFWFWSVQLTIGGEVQPAWYFSLPSSPSSRDLFSLANMPASGGGGGITPPAGDIGGTTTAPTVVSTHLAAPLPVAQGGTGTATGAPQNDVFAGPASGSGAPAFRALVAGDIPSLAYDATGAAATAQANAETYADTAKLAKSANLSDLANAATARTNLGLGAAALLGVPIPQADLPGGTTSVAGIVQIDGTAADMRPDGVAAAGSKGEAADAQHVHPLQPWQFLPEAYGAKGDGRIINDATVGAGNLSQLTSATAAFTSADTGKTIMINGGQGNNAQPLITTITYVSATTVTLAHAASGAITGASAVYGTDDTAAIQSAVTAAGNYAMAAGGPFHAQVLFGARIYCLATPPPVTSGIAGSTTCQVRIPAPNVNGSTQKLIIDLLGAGSADANMYFDAAVPNIQGTALVSMCIPPFTSGTNPYPSVVGYQYAADGSLTGGFANTKAYVDGITVVIPYLGPQGGYDFRFLGGAGGGRFGAMAFGAPANGAYNNLANLNNLSGQQNGTSVGLFCPLTGNNDDCTFVSFTNQGFVFGVNVTEHCSFQRLSSVYDIVGIQCVGGGAHVGASAGYASVEQVFAAVQYTGTSPFPLYAILDTEQVSTWHVQDTQQALYGRIVVHTNSGAPAVLGAANTEVIWDVQPRAVESAPAYTLGTAFQNPWWHHATITLAGGTVTGISVGPSSGSLTALGITAGTFRLPSGWWLAISGSVKPATFIAVLD